MLFRKKRSVADEAAEFGATLMTFLTTLGGVIKNAAEWLGLVGLDAMTSGADVVAEQAGVFAGASRAKAKRAKKRGRRGLFKLALIGAFVWWLDRELSKNP